MVYLNQFMNNIFFMFLGILISHKIEFILGFLSNCLDEFLLFKIHMGKKINECLNFNTHYCNLEYYMIHQNQFIEIDKPPQNEKIFNFILFQNIYKYHGFEPEPDSVIMIRYKFNNKYYRIYINYKQILDGYTLNLPIEPKKIIEFHEKNLSKNKIYFLKNETQDIEYAYINNIECLELIKECNGLLNDFGVLNNNGIKIKYIMNELKIQDLENFKLKYTNFHLDEDKLELIEHTIENENKEKLIMSDLMKEIILET